jgi:hypothetical protein
VSTRTTLTLDDDVAAGLKRAVRATGRPFRAVVNDAIRAGLEAEATRTPAPFKVTPFDLGLRKGVEIDSISELLDRLEGPLHR